MNKEIRGRFIVEEFKGEKVFSLTICESGENGLCITDTIIQGEDNDIIEKIERLNDLLVKGLK